MTFGQVMIATMCGNLAFTLLAMLFAKLNKKKEVDPVTARRNNILSVIAKYRTRTAEELDKHLEFIDRAFASRTTEELMKLSSDFSRYVTFNKIPKEGA